MSDDPEVELKYCPFCDGTPELVYAGNDTFYVVCTDCAAGTSNYDRDTAIKQWNRRAVGKDIASAIEELIQMTCSLCKAKTCNGKGDCSGIVNARKALAELRGERE